MPTSHALGRPGLFAAAWLPSTLLPRAALAAYPDEPIRLVTGYAPGGTAGMLGAENAAQARPSC